MGYEIIFHAAVIASAIWAMGVAVYAIMEGCLEC
jgi:hypothetical protein